MALMCSINLRKPNLNLQVDFATPDQGITAIYGPSGSGKTTLLRIIAGLEKGDGENIVHLGNNCWQNEAMFVPTHQRKLAYIFQQARLFPHLTVEENLQFAYQRRHNSNGIAVSAAIEQFGLADLHQQYPQQLSGGQAQRVAIARALVSAPDLLLMDEPLAALDEKARHDILSLLENLHRELQIPVMYVSHQLEEVSRLADNVVLLDDGKVIAQGGITDICQRAELPIAQQTNSACIWHGAISNGAGQKEGLIAVAIEPDIIIWVSGKTTYTDIPVRLRIPINAVSVSLEPINTSSIINSLAATVEAIQNDDQGKAILTLVAGTQILLASITQHSVAQLNLHIGTAVFAHIKGVALLTDHT